MNERIQFEAKPDRDNPEDWCVGAVDHGSEGEIYIAVFVGICCEQRAREYAAWKNFQPNPTAWKAGTPQEQCDDWNRENVPGRAVMVVGQGQPFKTVTRTGAIVLWGTAVIQVAAFPGQLLLKHVKPYAGTEESFEYSRACGDVACAVCGKTYFKHPSDLEHLGQHGIPFLVVSCCGDLLKL